MGLIKGLLYWGYLDDRGVIHIKRYMNDRQIWNCEQMPFCRGIFDPFEAYDAEDAKRICHKKLQEEGYYQKDSH